MNTADLRLYFAPGSCSLVPLVALYEANAIFEAKSVMLTLGEQNEPAFKAINPRGRIPALSIDGRVITEVIAIVAFINARYPHAQLLPNDDPLLLARAYERMSWYATTLHVAVAQCFRTARFSADENAWPSIQAQGRLTLLNGFDEIEALLTGPWVLGDRYSLLDAYTLIFWRWGERLGLDMSVYGQWMKHRSRLLERPAVAQALSTESTAVAAPVAADD